MEPQTEPRRRRRPQQIVIEPEPKHETVQAPQQAYSSPEIEPQTFQQQITPPDPVQPKRQNRDTAKKKKKRKPKPKRSIFLLLSFLYIIVYFFYLIINATSNESIHALFCVIAGLFGFLGYLFNSTTLALIPLFVYSVSAVFNIKFVFYLLPAILLNGIGYYLLYREKEKVKVEKERIKQQEEREEMIRQAKELQGVNSNQPIVIIQNTNTNQNTNSIDQAYPYKSKWTAFFLALFLGMFGAHQAYVGRGGMAIIYFLTFGLFGIGWILDTISILFGMFTDKWGHRLK